MKRSNISGWKDVYSFTLIQTLKSKAFIVSYVIFLVIALVSMPLLSIFTSKDSEDVDGRNPISKVYVFNETSLPMPDFSPVLETEALSHIEFFEATDDYDSVLEYIDKDENNSVALKIEQDNSMYSLSFVKASDGPVKNSNLQALGNEVQKCFNHFKIASLGLTKEQSQIIFSEITTAVTRVDNSGEAIFEEDTSITTSEYWFIYGILFVVLMVNVFASSQIATSIVTDKASKVLEYLLTSVKPLAIMVGKILAMLTAVLLQIISMLIIVLISNLVSSKVLMNGNNVLEKYLSSDIIRNLNVPNVIFCIVLIALGMIFYAGLAGLAGATVSRIEEASESLTLFTITNLVGAYVGMGAAGVLMGSGENAFVYFSFIFPLSSPFILPGAILIGKANILFVVIALILQVIFIVLLFKFVSRVYETLIMHNGNRIKLKELFKISKTA